MKLRDVIDEFAMERHHIAGWYSPHYSDSELLGRARLSSMYVLLAGDEPMPFHKLDGVEVWHHYLGAAAEFVVGDGGQRRETRLLGTDLVAGQQPQLAIPAYFWQSCRSLGEWTLLGCTMSPGYSPRSSVVLDAGD